MTKKQVLDLYFLSARHQLIEIAAFLDRVDRAYGEEDFRIAAFKKALEELGKDKPERAKRLLELFSDPTSEPIERSDSKSAAGAYNPGPFQNK
ncbi:MAG: hypothetical protein ACP5MG_01560 [Verrucomicrobiia bacterium]|jgi:hypothetical protein